MLRASQKDSLRVIVKLTLRFSVCLSLQKGRVRNRRPQPCNTDCYTDDNRTQCVANLIDHLSLKKESRFILENRQKHF